MSDRVAHPHYYQHGCQTCQRTRLKWHVADSDLRGLAKRYASLKYGPTAAQLHELDRAKTRRDEERQNFDEHTASCPVRLAEQRASA